MKRLLHRVNRIDPARTSAIVLALPMVAALAAYVFVASTSRPTAGPIVAAATLLAVAAGGLVYAWRLGPGGLTD
jgi:zinc transporter ZupT